MRKRNFYTVLPEQMRISLREHLRYNENLTVHQIIFFFRNYQLFSIKSYVVAIYYNYLAEAILIDRYNIFFSWKNYNFKISFNTNHRFPPFFTIC